MTDRRMLGRIGFCAAILFLAFVGLGSRLAFLHLGDHDERRANIQGNRQVTRTISVRRGRILERSGTETLLAVDMAVRDVCADPSRIAQENAVVTVSAVLSEILNIPVDEVVILFTVTLVPDLPQLNTCQIMIATDMKNGGLCPSGSFIKGIPLSIQMLVIGAATLNQITHTDDKFRA